MEASELLKQARDARGLSQQEAANKAGLTVQHWGQIERGKERGSNETLANMAVVLGITPEQLEDAGRDKAADLLRQFSSDGNGGAEGEGVLDDVVILQTILRKLTVSELRWIVDHAEVLAALSTHQQRNAV